MLGKIHARTPPPHLVSYSGNSVSKKRTLSVRQAVRTVREGRNAGVGCLTVPIEAGERERECGSCLSGRGWMEKEQMEVEHTDKGLLETQAGQLGCRG